MGNLAERLSAAIDSYVSRTKDKRPSNAAIGNVCGVSRTTAGNWVNGITGIDAHHARKLAAFLGCNPIWLETGDGEPEFGSIKKKIAKDPIGSLLTSDAQKGMEEGLLLCFRGITQDDKDLLLMIANKMYSRVNPEDKKASPFNGNIEIEKH